MSKKIYCRIGWIHFSSIREEGCKKPTLCCRFCEEKCRSACDLRNCDLRLSKNEAVAYLLTEHLKENLDV